MDKNYDWETRIIWTDELATGNEKIDEQHKKILNITNVFIDTCLKGEGKKVLGEMLDFLIDYTVEHFAYEEKLMTEYNYPEYKKHKKLHDNFKITVIELKKQFDESGASDELNKNLSITVIKWLIGHIKFEDFKIARYIRKINQDKKGEI